MGAQGLSCLPNVPDDIPSFDSLSGLDCKFAQMTVDSRKASTMTYDNGISSDFLSLDIETKPSAVDTTEFPKLEAISIP